jgi:hypothetical protein
MKKITYLLFALFVTPSLLLNAQTTITETLVVDISGTQSVDEKSGPLNDTLTVLLDGLATTSPCINPTLELTGIGWDTEQTTVGLSYYSEMVIGVDANQDSVEDMNRIPGANVDDFGTASFSSGGIQDLITQGYSYFLIANATSGSINLEFYEDFDDAPGADAVYSVGSTLTFQYRLSCSNTLSVDHSLALDSLVMYPNITEDYVTISNPQSIALQQAEIYDFSGKLIQTYNLTNMGTVKTIDVSKLASANYLVKIKTDTGYTTKKLLKK